MLINENQTVVVRIQNRVGIQCIIIQMFLNGFMRPRHESSLFRSSNRSFPYGFFQVKPLSVRTSARMVPRRQRGPTRPLQRPVFPSVHFGRGTTAQLRADGRDSVRRPSNPHGSRKLKNFVLVIIVIWFANSQHRVQVTVAHSRLRGQRNRNGWF